MAVKKVKLAPIVSSAKSAQVICRLWDRKYKQVPDFVVVEGPLAGGHLGFSREELAEYGAVRHVTLSMYMALTMRHTTILLPANSKMKFGGSVEQSSGEKV